MQLPDFASFFSGRKPVKKIQDGNLVYLDGAPLLGALKLPRVAVIGMAVLMGVAAALGVWAFSQYYDATANAPKRAQEELQANLSREVDLGLPVLSSFVGADNQAIIAAVEETGATIMNTTSEDEADAGDLELAKLPEGVGLDQAAAVRLQGVTKASPAEAALLLNGAWTMNVVRSNDGVSYRLHYCDLSATSAESAIAAAMAAEGFPAETATEAGVDDAGNNFQAGKIDVNGTTCTWRVSVCPLSAVYDISGFPEGAQYVGIRLTA
ncbi:hypothetical protein [Parvibacter caecicola]|uniref:hypothetical protein n=1 Tax=Parvibacter caecicola TaxID=747645 RepID=UPI0023F02BF0|nr:hypothetical protein [Parvibacter caecicola]